MFKFDAQKAKMAILLILEQLREEGVDSNMHKVFKTLYFAEMKHLNKFARPIVGDAFIAMQYGPVPSKMYDAVKEGLFGFSLSGYDLVSDQMVDRDYLADSEVQCLLDSIAENKNLSFGELCDKSHDKAWQKAGKNAPMSYYDIAEVGGAGESILSYMEFLQECDEVFA